MACEMFGRWLTTILLMAFTKIDSLKNVKSSQNRNFEPLSPDIQSNSSQNFSV